jgi:hypothetical protein
MTTDHTIKTNAMEKVPILTDPAVRAGSALVTAQVPVTVTYGSTTQETCSEIGQGTRPAYANPQNVICGYSVASFSKQIYCSRSALTFSRCVEIRDIKIRRAILLCFIDVFFTSREEW